MPVDSNKAAELMEKALSKNSSSRSMVKEKLAESAGLEKKDINDKNLIAVNEARRGAGVAINNGLDPRELSQDRLRVMGGGDPTADTEEEKAKQRMIAKVLIQAIPILVGASVSGAAGGAIGGRAGQAGVAKMEELEGEELKQKTAREEKAADRAIKQAEAQTKAQEQARRDALDKQNYGLKTRELDLTKYKIDKDYAAKLAEAGRKEDAIKPDQFVKADFAARAQQAESALAALQKTGYDPTTASSSIGRMMPEYLKSENAKLQAQAEKAFVMASLRPESGAAISDKEIRNEQEKYFPRAGDTPAVVEQKRQARELKIAGLRAAAGPAYAQVVSSFQAGQAPAVSDSARISAPNEAVAAPQAPHPSTMSREEKLKYLMGR